MMPLVLTGVFERAPDARMQISQISLVKMTREEFKNLMQNLSKGLVTSFSKETKVTLHSLAPLQSASINQ